MNDYNSSSYMRLIALVMFVFMITGNATAQTVTDELMDKYVKLKNLKDSLEERTKTLDKQLKNIDNVWSKKLKQTSDSLGKAHKKELNDTVKALNILIKEREGTIKALQKNLKNADSDAVANLNDSISALTKERNALQESLRSISTRQHAADSILALRDAELEMLRPFRELQLKQTLETAKAWDNLPLSQLDQQAVEKLIGDCQRYGGNSDDFKEAAEGLTGMLTDLKQFNAAKVLLEKKYDEQAKKAVRQQLKALKDKYNGKPQYKELQETDMLLRDYDGYVLIFKDLIAKLDGALNSYREMDNKNLASDALKDKLENAEVKQWMTDVEMIPYLKKRLAEYVDALKQNPHKHWQGEEEIKNMVK